MNTQTFYDRLAGSYHLLYADWERTQAEQAESLQRIITKLGASADGPVLDVACGVGTQALGLAATGRRVHGIDLSLASIHRARCEARRRGLGTATFEVGDMRRLTGLDRKVYAAAIACDNPLAHLVEPDDLARAARSIRAALGSGSVLVLSSRDYDALLKERPTMTAFRARRSGGKRLIIFQLWDWHEGSPIYEATHVIVRECRHRWTVEHAQTTMRAHTREELSKAFTEAGFDDVRWWNPSETGYFQPMMTGVVHR